MLNIAGAIYSKLFRLLILAGLGNFILSGGSIETEARRAQVALQKGLVKLPKIPPSSLRANGR